MTTPIHRKGGFLGHSAAFGTDSGVFDLKATYGKTGATVPDAIRRKLVSISGGASTGMHSTSDIPGRPSTTITVAYWWKANTFVAAGGDNPSFWAGNAGDYQIYYFSGGVSARIDGSNTYRTEINMSAQNGNWVFMVFRMGQNHSGTTDISQFLYTEAGTLSGSDTSTSAGSSTEITTNGTHWLLGDDSVTTDTDNGIIAEIFDFCVFDGEMDISDLQIDTSSGGWKDLTQTGKDALVYRIDGQNASDAGEDSSGNGNHFTVENGGVTLSDTNLPSGAESSSGDIPLTANGTFTGTVETFTGYSGEHTFVLYGAGGGGGTSGSSSNSPGGDGASLSGTITLVPSDVVEIFVGQGGTGGTTGTTGRTGGQSGTTGVNSGGGSGNTTSANYINSVGGSGGGATTLLLNSSIYAVAAGGGGGGSGDQTAPNVSSAGGDSGSTGTAGNHGTAPTAGTANGGGGGGGNSAGTFGNPGSPGSLYAGGSGGDTNGGNAGSGGGGGAGYYGGGGGASGRQGTTPSYGGGGAGGGSLVPAGWTLTEGGGGSGGATGNSSGDGGLGNPGSFGISPV